MEQTAGNLFSTVAEQGAIFAVLLLVVLALGFAVRVLYTRNIEQGDKLNKAFTESTIAINNNTKAIEALEKEIARK